MHLQSRNKLENKTVSEKYHNGNSQVKEINLNELNSNINTYKVKMKNIYLFR